MMITDSKSFVNHWRFNRRHECRSCGLGRVAIAIAEIRKERGD